MITVILMTAPVLVALFFVQGAQRALSYIESN